LHDSVVEELLKMNEIWGGHRENRKLRGELQKLDLSVYTRQSDGQEIVVLTRDLIEQSQQG